MILRIVLATLTWLRFSDHFRSKIKKPTRSRFPTWKRISAIWLPTSWKDGEPVVGRKSCQRLYQLRVQQGRITAKGDNNGWLQAFSVDEDAGSALNPFSQ